MDWNYHLSSAFCTISKLQSLWKFQHKLLIAFVELENCQVDRPSFKIYLYKNCYT